MPALEKLKALRKNVLGKVEKIAWLGPLVIRITVGVVFIGTGWGKLHSLDDVTKFFGDLHIPAPHFNAILAATTEFVGGLCILCGLLTRFAALPLAFTMFIAMITAKRDQIDGFSSLLGLEEFTYLAIFLWLAVAGAGRASIDRWLAKRLEGPAQFKPLLKPRSTPPQTAE